MNFDSIYSVPLWKSEYPNFESHRDTFLNTVREYRKNNSDGVYKSNVCGYQSPATLHETKELDSLFTYICKMGIQACRDLEFFDCNIAITSAWLNINNTRQCMNGEHVHSDIFSGVFYLKAPKGSGRLCITNPSMNRMWDGNNLSYNKNKFTAEGLFIEPEEGSIILFPSYIPHAVETNDHDDERISISFNIIALPKESISS